MIEDEAGARDWLASSGHCDAQAIERLECLVARLGEENARQNLVSSASLQEVWRRHIADSAQLLDYVPRETPNWLDLGTGAGFPGLVVAAIRPDLELTMVESRARRVDWLERMRAELGLARAHVYGSRVETMAAQKFRVISARAFAPLDRLLSLSARFSTNETIWLLPKGRSAQQEVDELRGWKHMFHVKQSLTGPDSGVIVGSVLGEKGKTP